MKFAMLLTVSIAVLMVNSQAQHYSAIHGSNYSGGLGVYNNPSSIVDAPFKWDLTLFATQFQTITNAVRGPNFPLNLSPNNEYFAATGNYKRFGDVNLNLRLLNTRIAIDNNSAIAFGVNLRSNTQVNTEKVNYNDSVFGPRTFLFYNQDNPELEARATSSSWMEFYLAYARTLYNNETERLNVGASLKILRGMAGGFAELNNIGIEEINDNDRTLYIVAGGTGRYGYSANIGDGSSFTASNLFSGIRTGFSLDLGVEYFIKSQSVSTMFDDESLPDYDWKIGASLLDIGWNSYVHNTANREAAGFIENVDGQILTDKFNGVNDVASFNDTVATLVNQIDSLQGNFKIAMPARAVINVDRYLSGNFYLNTQLSLNLASGRGNNLAVKEPAFLTVTPRWETRKLGFFMPVQVNRHGNFWVGVAVKAGPLLLGTHNLLNAFSKTKYISGGAYIAITIRPINMIRSVTSRQYDCPEY